MGSVLGSTLLTPAHSYNQNIVTETQSVMLNLSTLMMMVNMYTDMAAQNC